MESENVGLETGFRNSVLRKRLRRRKFIGLDFEFRDSVLREGPWGAESTDANGDPLFYEKEERACKPGSVESDHLSWTHVTMSL